MTPMQCNQVQQRLSDYLDGAVTGQEMREIVRHIDGGEEMAGCDVCAGELAAWRTTQNALVAVGPAKAPADLALKLRLAVSHEKARRESRVFDRLPASRRMPDVEHMEQVVLPLFVMCAVVQ